MPDSQGRSSQPVDGREPKRDDKIEELLLGGLDHYLAGEYDQAVDVWTRVLFFDRHHARARAYIDRARSALAERQRESEALLDNGMVALQRGETVTARRLITSAVNHGGASEDAQVLLERLDRLEAAGGKTASPRRRVRLRRGRPAPRRDPALPRQRWLPVAIVVGLGALVVATAASWDRVQPFILPTAIPAVAAPLPADDPLPVPSRAELALSRARSMFQRGHLHEALRLLDRMPAGDPLEPESNVLRMMIQRTLLTGAEPGTALDVPSPVVEPAASVP